MGITTVHYTTLLILLVMSCLRTCHGAPSFSCREDERNALLQFKAGLDDSNELLSSWSGRDCCSWSGVACNNRTSHVTRLDLGIDLSMGTAWVEGREINPCLLALPELRHLDLSGIHFHGAHIPRFIGSFKRLGHLNLANTYIAGRVPPELGNLSGLHHLDLSMNSGQLKIEDSSWLSHLSSLQYLDLSEVEIKNASRALHALGMLLVLSELRLVASLTSIPRKLPRLSFTSLRVLDISANECNTTSPEWPFEIGSLKKLNLSGNHFSGLVPNSMENLTSLKILDLSSNKFERDSLYRATAKLSNLTTLKLSSIELKGQLPLWLGDLKNLKHLDLSSNQFNGTLPASLGHLSGLVELDLSNNSFDGAVTETHFRDLVNLKRLDLSGNSLTIDIKPEWSQPWQLDELALDDCKVGPAFPSWLRKMENISSIQMFNVGISDGVPDWFWNFSLNILYINMSKNMIEGRLPTSLRHLNYLTVLDMSNNQLEGQIPQLPTMLEVLHLSNNMVSGSIPRDIGEISSITYLDVSANKISDSIPSSICKLEELEALFLSHNQLSGHMPDCWDKHNRLNYLDLSKNDLSGTVPASVCSGSNLKTLQLNSNNLSGGFPLALQHCSKLEVLDIGNNKFSGSIPIWLGRILTRLIVLRLQSNMFDGIIPANLGNLSSLVVIDLSRNILSGHIPQTFANLSAMNDSMHIDPLCKEYGHAINMHMKGREDGYSIQSFVLPVTIDLSSNNLSGGIPEILTSLQLLQNLNLSRNSLTGKIPGSINELQKLESLDLSFNHLTGEIPWTISTLSLSIMNFSFNDFSGRIPTGGTFDSHPDPSIYMGNDHLCGFPLDSTCGGNLTHSPNLNTYSDDETDDEEIWFYASTALGFVTGFWALVGSLLLIRKWRIAYYRCIDHACDKLSVHAVINLIKTRRVHDASNLSGSV